MSLDQHPVEKIGKYKVQGVLGKGGMGIVYKGLDPDIEREVAIKTIRFDSYLDGPEKDEMLNRVMREAKAAGRLNHPNIITIYDVLRDDDLTFIVMQYVEGQTLQALIESGKVFSPPEVIAILKPVADALDFAHQNGIVHRDIKPANILLDTTGKPFLADFGVARMETSTMTGPGTTIGTLSYMSPEQIMGKTADGRADFFALGVILYELLAGRKPFVGENMSTIVYKIVHDEPQRVTDINQNLPPGYEAIIRRALAKNPDERYQSGREMIADLEEPGHVAEASRAYQLKTGVGLEAKERKKRPFALAVGLLFFAIAAVVVYVIFLQEPGKPGLPRAPQQTPQKQDPSPSSFPASPVGSISPSDEILARLKESFDLKKYDETLRLAREILSVYSDNAEALEYQKKARAGQVGAQVAALLLTGKASFENGNFAACVQTMESVLRLEAANKEAQDYLSKAENVLSERDIRAMVERHRVAEENEDLDGLLKDIDPRALASAQRDFYAMLFTIYERLESKVPNDTIAITLSGRAQATANFKVVLRGVSKKDGSWKPILFYSQKKWELEKQGNYWKIVDIQ